MRRADIGDQTGAVDGYWLPRTVRAALFSNRTEWETLSFAAGRECGRECEADTPGAVAARWPRLAAENWTVLVEALGSGRDRAPRGGEFWDRLESAMVSAGRQLADAPGPARGALLEVLSSYTGYSPAMVGAMMAAPEMWDVHQMRSALGFSPARAAVRGWEPLDALPGLVRFFPGSRESRGPSRREVLRPQRLGVRVGLPSRDPLFTEHALPEFVVGYGAGNVPGTALIIVLLSLATTLAGDRPPIVIVRNSRREPIFSPLVLSAIEEADPDLLASVAMLVWDYEDAALQRRLLDQADLVIAAAGDDTIAQLSAQIARESSEAVTRISVARSRRSAPRFHAHGHKVSFSAISREMFASPSDLGLSGLAGGCEDLLDVVAFLAALDSSFWDQNGCLSSRVHFVERELHGETGPLGYGERLTKHMRILGRHLPRGEWPRRHLHDAFDRYNALGDGEVTAAEGHSEGGLKVLSSYDDDFVVVVDQRSTERRPLDRLGFATMVNDCQGRVIIVRAVDDLMEIPRLYLRLIPSLSLQSLSVAVGKPGQASTPRFLDFAAACGARGVTAIRVVGRGAFPQLAYSWDGFLPLDLVRARPAGHFTTIEFDEPYTDLMQAYSKALRLLGERADAASPPGDGRGATAR